MIIENPALFNLELLAFFLLGLIPSGKKITSILDKDMTDAIKGFAIFIIIVYHLRCVVSNKEALFFFSSSGLLGVSLFLFLSGYGLQESAKVKESKNFFFNKLIRIYIPFVLMNCLWLCLYHYFNSSMNSLQDNIFYIFGFNLINDQYWYIIFSIFWYTVFHIINNLKIEDNVKVAILMLVSVIVLISPNFSYGRNNAFSFPLGVFVSLYSSKLKHFYDEIVPKSICFYLTKKFKKNFTTGSFANPLEFETLRNNSDSRNHFEIKSRKIILIFFCGIASFLLYALGRLSYRHNLGYQLGIFYICILLLLILIYFKRENILSKISTLVFIVFPLQYLLSESLSEYLSLSLSAVFAILFIFLTLKFFNYQRTSLFFKFLGLISFELFLVHGPLITSYDFILYKAPLIISFPIYFFYIVVVSLILHKFFNMIYLFFRTYALESA